ncbi:type II toxin-antitoxin system HigA family antitoxin [Proteus vulgaris]|uniref:type II toxin-antitoxin system HigA family antitoxin n=1 Tax=Proteus vulgaris TaxID=585 RepID=UPI0034D3D1F0
MTKFKLRILKNDSDYDEAMERISELMDLDPDVDSDDGNELEMIALLIEDYEKKNCHIEKPSPIEAIKFRMDQSGMSQKDMIPFIGSASKVSEVLNGKRPLSINMIKNIHSGLGIPLDILIQNESDLVESIDSSSLGIFIRAERKNRERVKTTSLNFPNSFEFGSPISMSDGEVKKFTHSNWGVKNEQVIN